MNHDCSTTLPINFGNPWADLIAFICVLIFGGFVVWVIVRAPW